MPENNFDDLGYYPVRTRPSFHPAHPDEIPELIRPNLDLEVELNGTVVDKASASQNTDQIEVPSGWITAGHAIERVRLAEITISGRRMRALCARHELESIKAKNHKNQWQHFINPASIEKFIFENRPANLPQLDRIIHPAEPDGILEPEQRSIEKPDPVASGQQPDSPDNDPVETDASAELSVELEALRRENRQLEIDKAVRGQMLDKMEEDRNRIYDMAMEWSKQVGQLEERVKTLQLGTPSAGQDGGHQDPTEAEVVPRQNWV